MKLLVIRSLWRTLPFALLLLLWGQSAVAEEAVVSSEEAAASGEEEASKTGSHLSYQWVSMFNRHSTGHAFASHKAGNGKVEVHLLPDGTLTLEDKGERSASMSDEYGSTGTRRVWHLRWKGTWKASKDSLELSLSSPNHLCEVHEERDGQSVSKTACETNKKERWVCEAEEVEEEVEREVEGEWQMDSVAHEVWSCHPRGSESKGSSARWVFGKNTCLRESMGRRRGLFESCDVERW